MSELSMPNFAYWDQKALKMLNSSGLEPVTAPECVVIGHITGLYDTENDTEVGERIVSEIDMFALPKYVALLMWLNPFGLASHAPKLALRIAEYVLGENRENEEKLLPNGLRQHLGI